MNLSIATRDQAAFADASQRFARRTIAGQAALADIPCADTRAEARISAAMAVQVRTEQDERPGCIRNLSPRGVMLSMAKPPRRGEFVEIVTGSHSLVGHVRWASDCRVGIALRNAIDVGSILGGKTGSIAGMPKPGRKAMSMPVAVHSPRDSHIVARQLQFAAMIAFGAVVAFMIAFCVNDLLADVISQVRTGLPG